MKDEDGERMSQYAMSKNVRGLLGVANLQIKRRDDNKKRNGGAAMKNT